MDPQDAAQMTADYRSMHQGQTKAVFFGKDLLQEMLEQEDCMGIRVYFAMDQNGDLTQVLVGAMADETDMTNGCIVSLGFRCPVYCDSGSALNGN